MYVSELVWYQKQSKRKALQKKCLKIGKRVLVCLMMLAVLSQLPWGDFGTRDKGKEAINFSEEKSDNIIEDVEEKHVEKSDEYANAESDGAMETATYKEGHVIILDPGHGGMDEGGSKEGIEEKTINLELAMSLRDKLEEYGFTVFLTREDDVEVSLTDRVKFAESMQGDMLISIHQNVCDYSNVSGIEVWYNETGETESERLARLMQQYLVANTGAVNRGINSTDTLYVIRESDMPSCLVETGFLTNEQERELLSDETYRDKIVQGLADAIWYYFNPKKMYLTFDDGPSAENTERILDILKERNIQATFFVVGENAKKHPDIIKRIAEEGHVIGIHCYSHSYDKIYAGVQDYIDDFEKARELIYEITGEEVWCYRFPGGSINKHNKHIYKEIIERMSELGYVYYDWNACFEDAVSEPNREHIIESAVESTLKRKKIIMLAHDTVDETAGCLDEVLDLFPEYEFLPLTKDVEPIIFK